MDLRQAITKLGTNPDAAKMAASDNISTQVLKETGGKDIQRIVTLEGVFQRWMELQDCVVGLFNSEKA